VLVKHIQKTSLIDFPGQIASTIFVGGCNFKCEYCYNIDLVYNHAEIPTISEIEVLDFLEKRKHLIDGVAITGGEPTCQKDIINFLKKLRGLDLKIKLDTNGYEPKILESIIAANLVDYIAMDIKAPLNNYSEVAGTEVNRSKILESINLIKSLSINYEFRTTVWAGFFEKYDIHKMLEPLKNAKLYFFHNFFEHGKSDSSKFKPLSKKDISPILKIAQSFVNEVKLRGEWY
jgi:pyruvate formate lyase activating enzyme